MANTRQPSQPEQNGDAREGARPGVLDAALAIRTARAVEQHLANVQHVTRLAIEEQLNDNEELRQQVLTNSEKTVALLQQLLAQMSTVLAAIAEKLSNPPVIQVPQTQLTLEQQPVTVNIPTARVEVSPNITVPEAQVVVQPRETKPPTRAIIHHSDGTQSTVELK